MNDFTSPDTGKVYTIVTTTSERGAWDKEGNYAPIPVYREYIFPYDDPYHLKISTERKLRLAE